MNKMDMANLAKRADFLTSGIRKPDIVHITTKRYIEETRCGGVRRSPLSIRPDAARLLSAREAFVRFEAERARLESRSITGSVREESPGRRASRQTAPSVRNGLEFRLAVTRGARAARRGFSGIRTNQVRFGPIERDPLPVGRVDGSVVAGKPPSAIFHVRVRAIDPAGVAAYAEARSREFGPA